MSSMHASVTVIIRPSLTPENGQKLARTIVNKLWPDAAGGAQWLTLQHMADPLASLIVEIKKRNQEAKVKFERNGFSVKMTPA